MWFGGFPVTRLGVVAVTRSGDPGLNYSTRSRVQNTGKERSCCMRRNKISISKHITSVIVIQVGLIVGFTL